MTMDGTENKQDPNASASGQGTSEKEPTTFTSEQVKEREQKAASDALAKAGRTAKALEDRDTAIKAREDKISQAERERDEAELAAARDDPDRLPLVQQKQALKKERADLNRDRTELEADKLTHQGEIEAAREMQREVDVWEVAKETGLDAVQLKEICGELSAQSREQIEKVAKTLSKGKTPGQPKPDSGRTSGGGKDLTKLSADEKLKEGFAALNKK